MGISIEMIDEKDSWNYSSKMRINVRKEIDFSMDFRAEITPDKIAELVKDFKALTEKYAPNFKLKASREY